MKKKLRSNIFGVSIAAVIFTAALCICGYYYFFIASLQKRLAEQGALTDNIASLINSEFRISLIILIPIILIIVGCEIIVFRKISKNISKSISSMASSLSDGGNVYDELEPVAAKIREQRAKKHQMDKIKRQFTANVSHELKTPLTSIMGYAELIENGVAGEADVKRFAGTIRSETQRLITLSADLVKLSQLDEAEETGPVFEKIDLYEIAQNCIDALQIMAEKRGVSLTLQGDTCKIMGSRSLIEDLVYNLCENAIRYNKDNGSVTVYVDYDGKNSLLKVADAGIGIPEKNQSRIFERFYRVDKSRSKATGGTGLGLAIVKHIVEYHNASISLESKENEGTVITVRFPE